ncbi:FecR family protein [Sphingobacterium yanglingense]|uniref:FecR family protein n=1 Tax=Sphingobacterium yanglingense TaxID=1437280 RepID=A0A4R6WK18_9SPHI|nr:FecR domain-containing protein [Sphingobacterium yanglingense]TDQ79267.1 FecR family protein [Sphingobacterium yanglingense]
MSDIQEIYSRFLARQCTAEEVELLMAHFEDKENAAAIQELIQAEIDRTHDVEIEQKDIAAAHQNWVALNTRIHQQGRIRKLQRYWVSVVAGLLLIALGATFYYKVNVPSDGAAIVAANKIVPGTNRATVTLADGSIVDLSDGHTGVVVSDNLTYEDGSAISGATTSATLTTPRGGQYRITLADGTKVWLNAASSLQYPARFDGDTREVTLRGEAYFEVAHNGRQRFIVNSGEQRTVVKGTKFNISAYPDDHQIATTLLEGSVAIQLSQGTKDDELLLKPDQEAVVKDGKMSKRSVDANEAMAWSQGKFMFTDAPLPVIMRQIARWYDVDVTYLQPVDDVTFTGSISRFDNIQDVLRKLALTDRIKFETQERRIMVKRE